MTLDETQQLAPLRFHGGWLGALAPFALFLLGVTWLGLSGAPDERGFWPILLAALAASMLLTRDRQAWAGVVLRGMSQPIVMLMILAWLLAGVLASFINASGFVESLVWAGRSIGMQGGGYVAVSFLICCLVSTATGTSLGTIILCAPLLYPASAALGADPVILMGAVLGGATFGDNLSPVSDTTIASASTQGADIGGVVRSRLRYALPAALLAIVFFVLLGSDGSVDAGAGLEIGGPSALPMLAAPLLVVILLMGRIHLLEGLLMGILAAAVLGWILGVIEPTEILYLDLEHYTAKGLIIEGMERGIGVSVFTLLLMGLVAGLEASGVVASLVERTSGRARSARGVELWIFITVSAAVLLTTHSVVALLAVGGFAQRAGLSFGIGAYRRANILDMTVCTYPFIVGYCIPTVLAASMTSVGTAAGLPHLSPLEIGLVNFHSWALLGMTLFAIVTGYGRTG